MRRPTGATAWAVLVVAVAIAAVEVVLGVPLAAGFAPVAQLVSFRAVVGLASLVLAAVVLAVPWLRRRLLAVGLVLTIGGIAQLAVLGSRTVPHARAADAGNDPLTVVSFNTADVVPPATIADLVEREHADVVALPETSLATARAAAALLDRRGRPMVASAARSTHWWEQGTALLVSAALEPGAPSGLDLPAGGVRVGVAGSPVVAGHTTAPTTRSAMASWRADTTTLASACADARGAVVAGDFNATLDHPGLRELGPCVDAAAAVGAAAHGTWPARAPTWLAAPIDHVLVDSRTWRVESFRVLGPTGGSDHRPVVARLARR